MVKPSKIGRLKITLKAITAAFVWLVFLSALLGTVFSFLGFCNFAFEILSHFRPLWCLFSMIAASFLFLSKRKRLSYICLGLALINSVQVISLNVPEIAPKRQAVATFKFLQMNIWGGKNKQKTAVWQQIEKENADVIGISELTEGWWTYLQPKLKAYPYRVVVPRYGGICLLSRFPIRNEKIEHFQFGKQRRPRVRADVQISGRWVTMIFAHPTVPLRFLGMRNEELNVLAQEVKEASANPVILGGDLNCTPWSYYFSRLLKSTNLHDSEKGFGYQPSWSAHQWVPLLCIDHCLISADLRAEKRYNGPSMGSDHLPVITVLSLLEKR